MLRVYFEGIERAADWQMAYKPNIPIITLKGMEQVPTKIAFS